MDETHQKVLEFRIGRKLNFVMPHFDRDYNIGDVYRSPGAVKGYSPAAIYVPLDGNMLN